MKALIPFLTMAFSLSAAGQTEHFPNIKWKEKETDHFMMRAHSTNHDPARKIAKRVWEEMSEILPSLIKDFEKKEFRTPNGDDPSKGDHFKFTVYLVADGHTFHEIVQVDAKRNSWTPDHINLLKEVGNYSDPQNRYLVINKTNSTSSGGGNEIDKTAVFVHSSGAQLLSGQTRKTRIPFWLSAGMGYYLEHIIFKKCSVHYLDFEKYYESEGGKAETVKGGTLDANRAWPSVIRKLSKKGKRVSLERVINAQITTLSPNETGYIFALTHFMVSNEARLKKYQTFVTAVRSGKEPTKELLLESFGYADDTALEKEWYEFLESTKFK